MLKIGLNGQYGGYSNYVWLGYFRFTLALAGVKIGCLIELNSDFIRKAGEMAGKIKIDSERCKGCGLCVDVCPKGCISMSSESNKIGYLPAKADNSQCTGCTNCAIICPDAVIEVYRQSNNVSVEPAGKDKSDLTREKA